MTEILSNPPPFALPVSSENFVEFTPNYVSVCETIDLETSAATAVFWPGSDEYASAKLHWSTANEQQAACAVEPGTAQDVAEILQIIGSTRTPFAVKGGGHNTAPGSSSTIGVQIAMKRFSDITYNVDQTVNVGAGLTWDQVYEDVLSHGRMVVGGRSQGVGVGGVSLSGGFSWFTPQHGLAVDNIVAYQLVTPDGTVTEVDESSQPDLFFALKGSTNNFGVVTRFTMKTFPQGLVWGGLVAYSSTQLDLFADAIASFNTIGDVKAGILTGFRLLTTGQPGTILAILFYDGATPPPGIFDDLLAIPTLTNNVASGRTFTSLVASYAIAERPGKRIFTENTPVLSYSANLIRAFYNESQFWASQLGPFSATSVETQIIPMLPSGYQTPEFETAWPPHRDLLLPSYFEILFTDPAQDSIIRDSILQIRANIKRLAVEEGQIALESSRYYEYPASTGPGTPPSLIYGENVQRLREIRDIVDPDNIMGLTGGIKF